MALSSRYSSYMEEEDWDLNTLRLVNCQLERYVKMLPRANAAELNLRELQDLAGRQQAAIEAAQQQQHVSREARLRLLQQQEARHRQLVSESARLQRVRERVEAQELKLKRLRALQGQVEQCRGVNGNLNSELEAVRALFNEKEKELAQAVSRVDMLMKQLHDLREVKVKGMVAGEQKGGGREPGGGALPMDLERLKQELVHRNKLNEQQSSHLAEQQQLLQQRKDEVQRMDQRIQELQQRLKKRRYQQQQQQKQHRQQQQQQQQQRSQSSQPGTKPVQQQQQPQQQGYRPPGWRQGPNVAAVEPYIQHAPRDIKENLYPGSGFQKQDPKYQTLPPNTKFSPGGSSDAPDPTGKAGTITTITTTQEVNNNEKEGGGGGVAGRAGGVKVVMVAPSKIPAIISSHFSAHRGQSTFSSPANRAAASAAVSSQPSQPLSPGAVKEDGKIVAPSGSSKSDTAPAAPSVQSPTSPGLTSQQQQVTSKVTLKGPRPFVNTFGKSGLPKWPPEPKKDEDKDEAGKTSASSSTMPKTAPPPPQPSSSSSAHHQQPPHHPQINICDEERQAGSGQSSPASSEGSGPLVRQGSGVFGVEHPLATTSSSAQSIAQPADNARLPQAFLAQSASPSLSALGAPEQPPRVPQSASSAFSTDTNMKQSTTAVVVSKAQTGSVDDTSSSSDPSTSSRHAANKSVTPGAVSQAASAPVQGVNMEKTGSTMHLNQRPAPTYRYASKNVIANTYMGRLGSSALERYQQLNRRLYSGMDSQQGSNNNSNANTRNTSTSQEQHQDADIASQKTLAGELRAAFGTTQPNGNLSSNSESNGLLSPESDGMTQFGLVGSPNYPDIASDKGSFKANTPKHIRRRHSDSDNEDASKPFHHLHRAAGEKPQNKLEDASNNNRTNTNSSTATSITSNEETSKAFKGPRAHRLGSEAAGGDASGRLNQGEQATTTKAGGGGGGKTASGEVGVGKKKAARTILKGENQIKSNNRVRFDPLALLLDASLEGELDLVTRTAREVSDVSTANDEGITALHNAICAGHYDIVRFLIEFGADVNSPDSDGWTPLHCAASCNNLPMVRFLVEHGSCIFATTISDNETAAEKCEEDEDGYDTCSDYLYSIQEKLGIANDGVVYAVFDYYVNNPDELPFRINDKLTVLRKGDEVEKEWWWARLSPNQEGYIPRNFLGMYPRVLPSNYHPHETSDC